MTLPTLQVYIYADEGKIKQLMGRKMPDYQLNKSVFNLMPKIIIVSFISDNIVNPFVINLAFQVKKMIHKSFFAFYLATLQSSAQEI